MGRVQRLSPDVVALLEGQHRAIKKGFARALMPGPGRQRRFDELRSLLAVHEAAEEAHVHPVARKLNGQVAKGIAKRLAEERSAKQLLADLENTGVHAPAFTVKLARLGANVVRHARHEEREEFAALRREVSPLRRRLLGLESVVTQMLAPTRPHPSVNGQLANKLSAPLVGPVDRARNLVGHRLGR